MPPKSTKGPQPGKGQEPIDGMSEAPAVPAGLTKAEISELTKLIAKQASENPPTIQEREPGVRGELGTQEVHLDTQKQMLDRKMLEALDRARSKVKEAQIKADAAEVARQRNVLAPPVVPDALRAEARDPRTGFMKEISTVEDAVEAAESLRADRDGTP